MRKGVAAGKRALVPLLTGSIFHGQQILRSKFSEIPTGPSPLSGHRPAELRIFYSKIGGHSQEFQVGIIRPHQFPDCAPRSFLWKNNLGGFRKIRKLEHYYIA